MKLDCGPLRLTAASFFRRDAEGGVPALFAGRQASYSYNTRAAIRKSCDLLGLKPGDEVLAPAYNCGSEVDPLLHAGLNVRLFPVNRQARIDPDEVERRITARTRAVYMIHYFGFLQPAAADLRALCDRHGLALLEDCALSLLSGASPVEGQAGDIAFFCLYKFFPVPSGGVMVINNPKITGSTAFDAPPPRAEVLRQILREGLAMLPGGNAVKDVLRRFRSGAAAGPDQSAEDGDALPDMPQHYYFDPALTDARISRLAALPIRSFNVKAAISARRANYQQYLQAFSELPAARPVHPELPPDVCPLNMPVIVERRDHINAALQARGIASTPWWAGYHRGLNYGDEGAARDLKDNVLSLPLHQALGPAHIKHIADCLRDVLAEDG